MSRFNPLLQTTRVNVNVPPEMEKEFNEWYNHVHLPDLLKCPGWLSARRFVALNGTRKYMALYELENLDAKKTKPFLSVQGWSKFEPYIADFESTVYQQIFPEIKE